MADNEPTIESVEGLTCEEWVDEQYKLRTVEMGRTELAIELEEACARSPGRVLTTAEYLQVGQFGNNGYYATHIEHGKTNVHRDWAMPLACLYKSGGYERMIEFGFGDGELGWKTVKAGEKLGVNIKWSGIESNSKLERRARENFQKQGLGENLGELESRASGISFGGKSLVVCAYSLDSVPPECFTVKDERIDGGKGGIVDVVIGVEVKSGVAREVYLTDEQMMKKGMSLVNGEFVDQNGRRFDLSSWRVRKRNQRAYVPVESFGILAELCERVGEGSGFVIIDEYRTVSSKWESDNLCLPKEVGRGVVEIEDIYERAGEQLLYYPTYLSSLTSVLGSLGFEAVKSMIEEVFAKQLVGERWSERRSGLGTYLCHATVATGKKYSSGESFIRIKKPEKHLEFG